MSEHKQFKVNQSAVILNPERQALILRQGGKWMLPGGRMEEGENPREGLKREIYEETGIKDLIVDDVVDIGISDTGNTYYIVYSGHLDATADIQLSTEHDLYAWVSIKDFRDYEYWHPNILDGIRKVLNKPSESYKKVDAKRGIDCIGVNVVFYCHDGKGNILLHKRSAKCRDEQGTWDSGAGAVEFGETLEEAVRREVREEYGTEAIKAEYVTTLNVLRKHNDQPTHWVKNLHWVLVDPFKVKNGEPEKIDELSWFTFDNHPEPMHSQWARETELLRKYLAEQN